MIPEFNYFNSSVKIRESYIKSHFPDLYHELLNVGGSSISERLYRYYHHIKEDPLCKYCGKNKTKYRNLKLGYQTYCSASCCALDPDRRNLAKQTSIEKYGVEHYTNIEKTKQTNLERYGVEWNIASKESREKQKRTNLEKYGAENPMQSDVVKEKVRETNSKKTTEEKQLTVQRSKKTKLERYGDENYSNINQMKSTKLARYGNEYYTNQEQARQTNLDRYGVDNPMKLSAIQEKVKQTNLDRYGVEYPMRNKTSKERNLQSKKQYLIYRHNLVDITDDWEWICKCPHPTCNLCESKTYKINSSQFYSRIEHNTEPCTNILPIYSNSGTSIEMFVRDLLDEYNIKYVTNDRTILSGKELDILIPEKQIAIECNGVYWHSKYDAAYHVNKFNLCKERGVQLISIWEDWITTKPQLVKSLILSKLGIYARRLYARQCNIKEIPSNTCAKFLSEHHIQGPTKSTIRLGLYIGDELISVMTFSYASKLSGSKVSKNEWVLSRFCTKQNTQVIGGAKKLLTYFVGHYHPTIITSFASNDISNGKLYRNLGFREDGFTTSYWYVHKDTHRRYHRSSFTKSRLKSLGYDINGRTEDEIMQDTCYYKIYDSGHVKYTLTI